MDHVYIVSQSIVLELRSISMIKKVGSSFLVREGKREVFLEESEVKGVKQALLRSSWLNFLKRKNL